MAARLRRLAISEKNAGHRTVPADRHPLLAVRDRPLTAKVAGHGSSAKTRLSSPPKAPHALLTPTADRRGVHGGGLVSRDCFSVCQAAPGHLQYCTARGAGCCQGSETDAADRSSLVQNCQESAADLGSFTGPALGG